MTAIKATIENRTILDFSSGKCSKNKIKQALRKCEFTHCKRGAEPNEVIVYHNLIKVGMYNILLCLPLDSSSNCNKLKRFGDFEVSIWDNNMDVGTHAICLKKDSRFSNQYWILKNSFGQLRITHLIDIIAHCYRLNKLRAFL